MTNIKSLAFCSHADWNNERKYQVIDDAGAGCTNEDYVVVGQAILQGGNGNAGACNQLPE